MQSVVADDDELICRMVEQQKALSFIFSQEHCLRFLPSQNSETLRGGFEAVFRLCWMILCSREDHYLIHFCKNLISCSSAQIKEPSDDCSVKRKNQNKYYHARVVTLIFMLSNIYQIFWSNHNSETRVNNQSVCCIKLMLN